MYISSIPFSLILLFIISMLWPPLMLMRATKKAGVTAGFSKSKIQQIQLIIFAFFILWGTYASFLSIQGYLTNNLIPPRAVILLIVPLMLFLFLIVRRNSTFKQLFNAIKPETLINLHVYRFIGGWFLVLFYFNLLPAGFALRAGWGDILTAITAVIITYFVFKKKVLHFRWAYAWNVFGLVDILGVVTSAFLVILESRTAPSAANDILEITRFPFILIPALAPAPLIFLHVITFKKLKSVKKEYCQSKVSANQ
jgi:hydrogenase-4 membrane subunit HyfE